MSAGDEPERALPTSPARIRAILESAGLAPKRSLGQNFLADPNVAAKIVRLAGITAGASVVEVGPGLGLLTLALTDAGARVVAVEKDAALADVLGEIVAGRDVRIEVADARHLHWPDVLAGDGWTLVSNLPYNVAATVVLDVLDDAPMIARGVVMVQREVGERLAAHVGDPAYGAVSVKVAFHARAEVVGRVAPEVFTPRPRVESALVRFDRHRDAPVAVPSAAALYRVVEAGFATRRKTLRNALRAVYGSDVADESLRRAAIDPSRRAEELDLEQWAALARATPDVDR